MGEHDDTPQDALENPVIPPGPGVAGRITERTEQRLVERTCAWCAAPLPVGGRGRPRRYCSAAHRQRDYELRTAFARRERDRAAGTARQADEPVREVVERTRVRTVVRTVRSAPPAGEAGPRPERESSGTARAAAGGAEAEPDLRARAVQAYLERVAAALADGRLKVHDHRRVFDALTRTAAALGAAHPGGLEALQTRR